MTANPQEIIEAFLSHDTERTCPFCSKDEWGTNKHDESCPYSRAYDHQHHVNIARATREVQDWLDDNPIIVEPSDGLTVEEAQALIDGDVTYLDDRNLSLYGYEGYYIDYIDTAIQVVDPPYDVDEELLYPTIKLNVRSLIRNTRLHVTVKIEETTVEEMKRYPQKYWYLFPDGVEGLANNAFYESGTIVALIDAAPLLEKMALKWKNWFDSEKRPLILTLQKGAEVTLHNYFQGSSSILAPTCEDIGVLADNLVVDDAHSYGVQACCGLAADAWNGELILQED